jgi:hypothetical protein
VKKPSDRPLLWPHIVLAIFIFSLMDAGLGYRTLSHDEAETAERGRMIVETGLPRVIGPSGEVSVFTGGREIEDGTLHRYTPWGQFYAAAAGVAVGRLAHLSQDRAVRLPFVVCHAVTSGLISYAIAAASPLSATAAVSLGLLYGVQTDRLLYNRTARYHAVMDLLVVLGWFAIMGLRKRTKGAGILLAAVIFLLPQTHTITGSLLSLFIGLIGAAVFLADPRGVEKIKKIVMTCLVPGFLSLICLLLLTRPWAQQAWGEFYALSVHRSYTLHRPFVYAYAFFAAGGVLLLRRHRRVEGLSLLLCFALILLIVPQFDRNQNAQFRYYLPLWLFCSLWPLGMNGEWFSSKAQTWLAGFMFVLVVVPEFSTRRYHPYHGLELVVDDFRKERKGVQQPLREAVEIISSRSGNDDAVLFDHVPLYANWYLPGKTVALMPDESGRHKLNNQNPIWEKPLRMPDWHVWYPSVGFGVNGDPRSDYQAHDLDMDRKRYYLTSTKLHQTIGMCVEKYWTTEIFNNHVFRLYSDTSLTPSGDRTDVMILAKKCE